MTAVPELRNDGIILNAHNDSEIAAHLAGEDEETARRFGWWPAYSTEETVRTAYANWARNWQEDGPVRAFAARDPGSGALVGNCELRIGPDGTGEVSYWTHAGKRGRGYARNALALLAGYAASIGVTRLEAHVAPDNHASRHVAESAGFTQADTFTDGDGTEFIRYTRDASGDGAAPFTKLGPDPDSSRPNQPCAARHGRTAQPLPPAARRRPGRQRSHPSGAGPADEVTRMTVFSARTLRPPSAPVHGTLFVPATAEPSAAVLLIGGSDGGEPSHMGEALAGEGVAALSVAYFARPGLPGKLRSIPLEYFFAALQTLQNELPSPDTPLAVLGISRGSEAAMLTAIHSPIRVRGVIAAVPGNVVLSGWPPGWPARRPAWLLDGRPLPYVNHFGPRCRDPDALIPVELVPGPILLVAAGADRVWPSAAMARALSGRLRQRGDSHGHTILEYPEAGHRLGGLLPQPPPGLLPQNTADEAPTRAARADAWPKAIEFIRQLRTPQ